MEYTIVSDNDGHDYVIPADKLEDWNKWLHSDLLSLPRWCDPIGGSLTLLRFKDYRIL